MNNGNERAVHTMVPAVDIVETKGSYIVTLDIPGAAKDSIKAHVEDNTLNVMASVSEYFGNVKEEEPIKTYRREFSLANDVDVNTIDAKYDSGVLTITLNKKLQYLPREISIN